MQTLKQCQVPGVDVIFSVAGEKFHAHKLGFLVDFPFLDLIFSTLNWVNRMKLTPTQFPANYFLDCRILRNTATLLTYLNEHKSFLASV
jgi:hypothetical protein